MELARAIRSGPTPQIAGYESLSELRRGGQGVVYDARQVSTKQRVAIKVLLGGAMAGSAARRRFDREAELAASLRHPGIVRVYDRGETPDGLSYLVMEFVEGRPLDEVIRRTPDAEMPLRERVELFALICEAVSHAHQRGVIHRDLKPSNIRVDDEGKPKVLDFGLAKASGSESVEVTGTGQFIGSLPWASPEAAESGAQATDVRSDIYSLGVILYQLVTGRFPYDVTGSASAALAAIRNTAPAPFRGTEPGADEDLQTIAHRCLAKEPDRRYQTADSLLADVRSWLSGQPILAKRDGAWYALRKRAQRHRRAAIAAVAALVATLAGAAWLTVLYGRATDAERRAALALSDATRELEEKAAAVEFLRTMLESGSTAKDGRDVRVLDVVDKAKEQLERGDLPAPTRAVLCATLADTFLSLSAFDRAEPLMRESLRLRESLHGPAHPETVRALVRLSYLKYREGEGDEALRLAQDAAERSRGLSPKDQYETRALEGLGLALHAKGDLAGSEQATRAALALYDSLGKGNEPRALEALGNLGVALRQQSKLAEAEAVYLDALKRTENRPEMGANHRDHLMLNYGSLLHDLGKVKEAEAAYRNAAAGMEKMLGLDHIDTLTAWSNLGTLLIQQGECERAREVLAPVVEKCTARYGAENASTLLFAHNLAKSLQDCGRLDEAESLTRQVVEARTRTIGREHPSTLGTLANLAAILKLRGQTAESAALDEEVLAIRRRKLGDTNVSTLISFNNVALARATAGNFGAALECSDLAINGAEKVLGPAHWMTATFRVGRGKVLDKSGRTDEAERELVAGYEGLKAALGDTDKRVRTAAGSLADFYAAHGRDADAASWRARS
ncbi:MAG: serine/threonine protein kinase, partial [Leptolyngbya sp. PLA1]|nr:serine/threonine protein kinase [Leptolyngbya sp. PLA1]